MNWRKVTIGVILACTAILIGYDIFIVIRSPENTLSAVTMAALWRFPFIAYAWMGLGGHFLSLIKTRKRYIRALVIISAVVLVFSFLTVFGLIKVTAPVLAVIALIGFLTGMICWSQRRR